MARRRASSVVELDGADVLLANLKKLGRSVREEVLEDAVHQGATIVRRDAIIKAPRDPGERDGSKPVLKESIVQETTEKHKEGVIVAIGPTRAAFHGIFQETGTPHHAAQPYLRPALDENEDAVVDKVGDELWDNIRGALRR